MSNLRHYKILEEKGNYYNVEFEDCGHTQFIAKEHLVNEIACTKCYQAGIGEHYYNKENGTKHCSEFITKCQLCGERDNFLNLISTKASSGNIHFSHEQCYENNGNYATQKDAIANGIIGKPDKTPKTKSLDTIYVSKDLIKGIYSIKNIKNNMYYIGQSVDIHKRWHQHKSKLINNNHNSWILQKDWNEYGESCFEFNIVKELNTRNSAILLYYESIFMKEYNSLKNGYNVENTLKAIFADKIEHNGVTEPIKLLLLSYLKIQKLYGNEVVDEIINGSLKILSK